MFQCRQICRVTLAAAYQDHTGDYKDCKERGVRYGFCLCHTKMLILSSFRAATQATMLVSNIYGAWYGFTFTRSQHKMRTMMVKFFGTAIPQ